MPSSTSIRRQLRLQFLHLFHRLVFIGRQKRRLRRSHRRGCWCSEGKLDFRTELPFIHFQPTVLYACTEHVAMVGEFNGGNSGDNRCLDQSPASCFDEQQAGPIRLPVRARCACTCREQGTCHKKSAVWSK